MRRKEGGGFRIGSTCIPVADHFDIWQNQYNIVKLKKKKKPDHIKYQRNSRTKETFTHHWRKGNMVITTLGNGLAVS